MLFFIKKIYLFSLFFEHDFFLFITNKNDLVHRGVTDSKPEQVRFEDFLRT